MSTVLDTDALLESPLADLHAIAGELDIEGYRTLRKPDLTIAILVSRGAVADEIRPAVEAKHSELMRVKAEREQALAEQEEREEAEREAARVAEREAGREGGGDERSGEGGGRSRRGRRGGRGRSRGGSGQAATQSGETGSSGQRAPRDRSGRTEAGRGDRARGEGARGERTRGDRAEAGPGGDGRQRKRPQEPTTPLSGVFEPGSGGGGRLRTDLTRRVRGDADVPRGEVRRWNLRRGDIVAAQVAKARRGRTDFVVGSIDNVNGLDLDARAKDQAEFDRREAAPAAAGYAKRLFKHAPVGRGSRLVITGATRAAASEMLKKLAEEIAGTGVVTTLVVVSARPEQSESVAGAEVLLGDATKAPDDIAPALELVLERDKRLAESGRETAVLIDGLDLMSPDRAAQVFNSARNLAQGGALTIAAACGSGSQLEALATSIGVVAGGRKLKIDKKASWTSQR